MHHAITVLVLLATAGLGIHSSLQIERTTQPAHTDVEPVTAIAVTDTANPLLETWDTPFGVPPFDRIGDEDYLPAFRVAMEEHRAEIAAIVGTPVEPSFANTIEAFERSGAALGRVANVFFAVEGAHGNDALREVARTVAPELAAHRDDVMLNRALYLRVKAVFDARDELDLPPEQDRLLEETHKAFVRRGVGLETEPQNRLRAINAELAELSQRFGQNLLKETNAFELHVTDRADLGELPASLVAAAADEARRRGHDSGWSFTLQRPSINPFLQYSPNREMRKRLFVGYEMRGDNGNSEDNSDILERMAALRAERAALMGYETHAHYQLSDVMAETPERVYELLDRIWAPALAVAKQERDALAAMMRADGIDASFAGWDWRYYAEKVRKARYDFDELVLRPYFEVTAVRDAAFMLANRLFGITFTELTDVPRWHPDQQVFEVREADGTHIGVMYMDFFARESKQGGAWMNDLRAQSRLDGRVTPIVTTNFNFPPPTDTEPSLLAFNEAETLMHEFGHALHGLLSDVTYESLSGTNVPRDFVEFPSQIMEKWLGEPEMLQSFAKHYRTGEVIPAELIEKLDAAGKFNQGFATVEYLAASYLDLAWHTRTVDDPPCDPCGFEQAEMDRIGLIDEIIPRYRSTYFAHIFSGGYSAGYYSYIWAEVLDADAFEAFKEHGLFDQETARKYREHVLSKGGTRQGMELYEAFRGRPPAIESLLETRGLTGTD
jgi:peptidyl-dipeptidase Dcp